MEISELVKEIRELMDFSDRKISDLTGDDISILAPKLASYNASLGEHIAALEREADQAEAEYEWSRETAYKEARERGTTISDADNEKRLKSKEAKQYMLDSKYNYRSVAILRADVNNFVDALRSRLSYLKQEREKS